MSRVGMTMHAQTAVSGCSVKPSVPVRTAVLITYLQVVLPVQILGVENELALRDRGLHLLIHLQAQLPVWFLACRWR